ncbi:MAG: DNA-binding domain-containing protein [Pseudomonadota bacterium]
MALHDQQRAFAATLLTADAADPAGLGITADGREAARLAVYRNNVQVSLIGVLEAAFPVTAKLCGLDNFRFAASRYLRGQPPAEARLLTYGDGFPAWLSAFKPAAGQPYLAEMARLEWARNEALFAADADPLDASLLSSLPPEAIGDLVLIPHPAARLLQSGFSLHAAWQSGEVPKAGAETLLITRPDLQVLQSALAPGAGVLAAALFDGRSLTEAAEQALAVAPDLDLQACLLHHLTSGSFSRYQLPTPT